VLERRRKTHQARIQEYDRLSQDVKAQQARYQEVVAQLRHLHKEREALQARLDPSSFHEAQAEKAYWEKQVRLWEEEVQRARARLQKAETEFRKVREAWTARRQRLDALRRNAQEHAKTEAQLRQRRMECEAQVTALREQLPPLEKAVQANLERVAQAREAETQAREALKEAEARYQEARLQVQRLQSQRATLWRRLREERLLQEMPEAQTLFSWLSRGEVFGTLSLPATLPGLSEEQAVREALKGLEAEIQTLRKRLKQLGPVVPELLEEYRRLEARLGFLERQIDDLRRAEAHLLRLLTDLEQEMRRRFERTFSQVQRAFQRLFTRLFGGGNARLVLTAPEDWEQTGVDIEVRLPGKRFQRLALLSGGERSLTAIALIFALLSVSQTPLCVLDEVDAMLDEANVGRFLEVLKELAHTTQFILITHNPQTIQAAQLLYGITLGEDGASQVLSLKLEDVPAWLPHQEPAAV